MLHENILIKRISFMISRTIILRSSNEKEEWKKILPLLEQKQAKEVLNTLVDGEVLKKQIRIEQAREKIEKLKKFKQFVESIIKKEQEDLKNIELKKIEEEINDQ